MTLLRTFRAHAGGLIRIKGELYWRGGAGWDGSPGRVCLVLDAADEVGGPIAATTSRAAADERATAALLLIDGCPHWIWVAREDVELIT